MRRGTVQAPESSLLDRLVGAGVCTPADFARARRLVHRLGDDLPMFESVWLDALVRLGCLTPHQVERIESKSDLVISAAANPSNGGSSRFVIVDHLGGGPLGETLLVRGDDGCRWVAKHLSPTALVSAESRTRLANLTSRLSRLAASDSQFAVRGPTRLLSDGESDWLFSPCCDGPSAQELLVSRGRFPSEVVIEMARQLVAGLARLEAAGLSHGDIRPIHIRLSRRGQVVLVDTGVRSALDPDVSIHTRWSVDRYDGIAPELIGTGTPADARSDHYALGCALWQLLTGRPPFPGGDPLGKLSAHQLRTIADPRELAPDTDDRLAVELERWMARDPALRPQSWAATHDRWSLLFPSRPRRVESYRAFCERPTPKLPGERHGRFSLIPGGGWSAVAALLLIGGGVVATLSRSVDSPALLAIGQAWIESRLSGTEASTGSSTHPEKPGATAVGERDERGRLPLPAPTAEGVIELLPNELYRPDGLSVVGALTIRTSRPMVTPDRSVPSSNLDSPEVSAAEWATILPDESPLTISCTELRIEGVRMAPLSPRSSAAVAGKAPPSAAPSQLRTLLHVRAARLDLRNVRFDLVDAATTGETATRSLSSVTQPGPAAIHWQPSDLSEARAGEARLENVVWFGHAAGITITAPLRTVEMVNCLKVGLGPAVALSASIPRTGSRFLLDHVTLRESGAAIRWGGGETPSEPESLLLEATDCVFQPHASAGLIEWFGEEVTTDRLMAVSIQGSGSIMPDASALGLAIDPRTRKTAPVDLQYVSTDGLAGETPRFIGPATNHPADSALSSAVSPRRTDRLQGIDPSTLAGAGSAIKDRAAR